MIITSKDDDLTIIPYSNIQKIECKYVDGFGYIGVVLLNGETFTLLEYKNSDKNISRFVYSFCEVLLVGAMKDDATFNTNLVIKEALESYHTHDENYEEIINSSFYKGDE